MVSLNPSHLNTVQPATRSIFAQVPLDAPLVLDLDGTLLRSDLLLESFVMGFKKNPLVLFLAAFWLVTGGRARLKAELAARALLDCDNIPENPDVVKLAEDEHAAGRMVVLATAADQLVARRIARRFAFITRVMASDGVTNLKSKNKATALAEKFPQGFIYAGDATADLAVWRAAQAAIVVTSAKSLMRKAEAIGIPTHVLPTRKPSLKVFAKAIRLQQSVKNTLIFAPLFLAGKSLALSSWFSAGIAFGGMVLVASATYLLNDLLDLSDDRKHWSKKKRMLASGAMPLRVALLAIPALFALGVFTASIDGALITSLILLYAGVTLGYSFHLKRLPLIDVIVIAGLFSLRLLIGVVAVKALFSTWLFVFSMALFLSIALAKRHTEVTRMKLQNKTETSGRGYRAADEPLILSLGTGTAVAAIAFFSLYLISDSVRMGPYTAPQFLWIAPVAIFLWLGRIWLLSQRGELNDDPVAFAVHDRSSILLGLSVAVSFVLAATVRLPL